MSLNGNVQSERGGGGPKMVKTIAGSRKSLKAALSVTQRVQLERVLGLTVTSNAGLACHSPAGLLAYTAGCVIVLFDPTNDSQQHLIVPNKRTLSALTFSADGRYLASGECGTAPCFRVWDMRDLSQICEVAGHKNGITHLAFSSDSKLLISVGTHHDNLVIVWDWRSGRKIATNKVMCKVRGLAFSEDGSFFVTVGNRHVKFWYLEREKDQNVDTVPLTGRSAVLGDHKDDNFLDVICGRGNCAEYTYAVTQSGVLCQFNSRRSLEKNTLLRASSGNCLSFGESGLAVGCTNGVACIYDPVGLELTESLPLPHFLGTVVSPDNGQGMQPKRRKDSRFPDCAAIFFDEYSNRVVIVYNDHSLYVWDIRDSDRIMPLSAQFFHSRCVWGLDIFPLNQQRRSPALPDGSFVTCSSDDTVRIWNVVEPDEDDRSSNGLRRTGNRSAIGIIYNDPNMQFLCNTETNPGGVDPMDVNAESRYGIRSVRIDPYGENIAFGDRLGHIHIYELREMRETYKIEAHDSEVLCLEFSKPESGYELLASASRDRLIQIFDVKNDYNCLQTLDDHSSSITALRFAALNGSLQFGLISCGVDKAVILRTIQYSTDSDPKFVLNDQILSKGGVVYDMDVDTSTQSIVTANQDRQLRVYGIKSRKLEKTVKGTASEEGALIKLDLQETGRFVATSCSDKNLAVIDLQSGECWAAFSGHAEIVTGIKFGATNSRLISVSGDGCVFVWKLQAELGSTSAKGGSVDLLETGPMLSPTNSTGYFSEISYNGSDFVDEDFAAAGNESMTSRPAKINLNDGLPSWAKTGDAKGALTPTSETAINRPGGRWADSKDDHLFPPGELMEALDAVSSQRSPLPGIAFEIPLDNVKIGSTTRSSVSGGSRPSSPATFQRVGLGSPGPSLKEMERTVQPAPAQPSILGFLGKPRRLVRDELDDDEDVTAAAAPPAIVRSASQTETALEMKSLDGHPEGDSETSSSLSYRSVSSPQPSRPETPSEAANKFLNLTTSGIDMMSKGRLPVRQSVTIKNRPAVATVAPLSLPPSSPVLTKSAPQLAPSKRLIQSVKLTANKQKFKSTQNLSTGEYSLSPATVAPNGGLEQQQPQVEKKTFSFSQGSNNTNGMRRATSMMNIGSGSGGGSGELQSRDGLDGYNSLLERAKARLAAIASRDKKDPLITTAYRPPLPQSLSRPGGFGGSGDSPTDNSTGSPKRLSSRFVESNLTSPRTVRSRSIDRHRTPSGAANSGGKTVLDNGTSAPVGERKDTSPIRSVRNRGLSISSTKRDGDASTPSGLSAESPTAQAIARIKADLGLAAAAQNGSSGTNWSSGTNGSSGTNRSSGTNESTTSVAAPSAVAKLHCRNLTSALQSVLHRLQTMTSNSDSSASNAEDLELYRETLLAVHAKLNPVVATLSASPGPVLESEPSPNPMPSTESDECVV